MPHLQECWDPNEWELHVCGLLRDRHGDINVMKVPARHKGDFGLDYYCLSNRVAYQCYAVQEPCTVADRATKQIAKITTDLKKFTTKQTELKKLFGEVIINRWILVVPLHDSSQVNGHLTTKCVEVKKLCISYIAADFEALVHDLENFDSASQQSRAMQRRSFSLPALPQPTPEEIETWTQASDPLVQNLVRKLAKRVGVDDDALLAEAVRQAVGWFLERENALEALRTTAPQLHENLTSVISRYARELEFAGPPVDGSANLILRSEIDRLISALKQSVPNFSDASAHQVAVGTIADWLLRCPLDFPPYHAS